MKKIVLILGLIVGIYACSSSNDNKDTGGESNFDRTAMLTNWADNIIIPSYTNYQTKVATLQTAATAFNTTPNDANLKIVRAAWLDAYKAFQYTAIYNFGKALDINFNAMSNTYPADVNGINANITGTYNLDLLSQYSRQGFPGLDYLLNGLASDDAGILVFYTTNANAAKYKTYLAAVITKLKQNSDAVLTDWKSGYREAYIKSNGTSVGSSVAETTNNFVKNFEKDVRTGKLGIPAGKFSNGTTFPEKVEAYYKNDVSKDLLNIGIKASQDFFNGKYFASETTGPSLKSYLDFVNATRDGKKLSDIINTQFATIYTTNQALSNSLSQQVINDNTKMLTSYDALQKNVIYTKLDMMQALNITIDYVDGDGD
ncbi:imelysin family protein [Flavobacterium sp. ABG]|uniref:imelysin family protein n=1 Tax=Flavobacterium sp. ABG TaxID=1423322 RepID=UPI000649922D|nr:imelysin family protein [Flavobacterium sp. ABG]KLT69159.1 iron-regulated protein A precursor [Flavobacterium sp. ABG]